MGKNNKKRRIREAAAVISRDKNKQLAGDATVTAAANKAAVQLSVMKPSSSSSKRETTPEASKNKNQSQPSKAVIVSSKKEMNPLWAEQRTFLQSISMAERDNFFSEEHVSPTRRAEIWMQQADLGERMVNDYAWATPDDRAIAILRHFSPIVEIGCGANAYWCRQMKAAGITVVGYDVAPDKGGTICATAATATDKKNKTPVAQTEFRVKRGGPEVLAEINPDRTLFLCYPDENDAIDEDTGEPLSMAAACLEHYQGNYIIHVGELVSTRAGSNLSLDQAPWGRSSSPDFQERLLSEYHCLLQVSLQNWLHTTDSLTVWKRSATTTIVFAEEGEDDDESDEEVEYRHIPVDERLPVDIAAPCLQHLLLSAPGDDKVETTGTLLSAPKSGGGAKEEKNESAAAHIKKNKKKRKITVESPSAVDDANDSTYTCPW
jgi:hypothetical protein